MRCLRASRAPPFTLPRGRPLPSALLDTSWLPLRAPLRPLLRRPLTPCSFWDYSTGYSFQALQTPPQPGSLDSEAGVYGAAFDMSGSRLITAEADKTIKVYREDDTASEETHPVDMAAWEAAVRAHKHY